jgi:cyclopropane fatty-acyl-phospholipid synthase-like methyltransferase
MKIEQRYLDESYLAENPDWDRLDAPWKALKVLSLLQDNDVVANSICEVGCGSGDILACLAEELPKAEMTGFDISPQASNFWATHHKLAGVKFVLGDFHKINQQKFDVLLMLDVFEHVRDPFSFLELSRSHANYFIFHIPLDLSAVSVARKDPLLMARDKVGHLHYYTKDLALATLRDSGYTILDWRYTGAALTAPIRSVKTRLASIARRLAYAVNKDFGVRLFGGETLLVLAKSSN